MKTGVCLAVALTSLFVAGGALRAEHVTLKEGTLVSVRLQADLLSDRAQEGARVDFVVSKPVEVEGLTVIPEGSIGWGTVQGARKNKFVRFTIQGIRLASFQQIKLRAVREKTDNPDKDLIRIESKLASGVGAKEGTEFMAYVAEDMDVEVATPEAVRTAPEAAVSISAQQPTTARGLSSTDLATVEFFSEPMGADILINGDYVGNSPSILKVMPGKHMLTFQLNGYKTVSQPLDLTSAAQLKTIRISLDKVQ